MEIDRHHDNVKFSLEDPSTNKDHMNTVLQEVDFVHSEVNISCQHSVFL